MAAGGPGDHPLSDVLHWGLQVYGPSADEELRQLAQLLSSQELHEWWETHVGWNIQQTVAAREIQNKLSWARTRAKESGWEVS